MASTSATVGYPELATLRQVALAGGLTDEANVTDSDVAADLDVPKRQISTHLGNLEAAGLLDRSRGVDGQWLSVTEAGETYLQQEYEVYRQLFEHPTPIRLRGEVTSGMGEGRHYISLPGYVEQFVDWLGYEPFPGTLNVELAEESIGRRESLAAVEAVPIDAWEGEDRTYGAGSCYPVVLEVDGRRYDRAHAIVPDRTHHDDSQLELLAPERLRDELGLEDGDELTVRLSGRS